MHGTFKSNLISNHISKCVVIVWVHTALCLYVYFEMLKSICLKLSFLLSEFPAITRVYNVLFVYHSKKTKDLKRCRKCVHGVEINSTSEVKLWTIYTKNKMKTLKGINLSKTTLRGNGIKTIMR